MSESDIRKKLEAIKKEINSLIEQLDDKKDPLSVSFNKAIDRKTSDEEYTEALQTIKNLPFKLSAKQFSWIVSYTRFHPECGDQIISFFKSQLNRDDRDQFIDTVAEMLRKSYTTEYNQDFIEGAIKTLKEMEE